MYKGILIILIAFVSWLFTIDEPLKVIIGTLCIIAWFSCVVGIYDKAKKPWQIVLCALGIVVSINVIFNVHELTDWLRALI